MSNPGMTTAHTFTPATRLLTRIGVMLFACLSLSGCYYYAYDTDPVNSDVYYGRDAHAYPATVYGHYGAYDDWLGFGFFGPFGYISYWDNHYYTHGYPHRYYSPYYVGRYYSHRHHQRRSHYGGRYDGHRGDRHRGNHDRRDGRDGKYDRPRSGRHLNPGRVREDNRVRHMNPRDGRDKGSSGVVPRQQRRSPLSSAVYQPDTRSQRAGSGAPSPRSNSGAPTRSGSVAPSYSPPPTDAAPAPRSNTSRAPAPRRSSQSGRSGKGERKRRQ